MSVVSDSHVGGNQNFEDLKKLVVSTLEKNGVLGELRAMIRSHVYNAIDKDDYEHQRPKAAKLLSTPNGETVAELVAEFLEFYHLQHALKVYAPEINLPHERKSRSDLAHSCNLSKPDPESSLLQQLLFQTTEAKPMSPKGNSAAVKQSTSPVLSPSQATLKTRDTMATSPIAPTALAKEADDRKPFKKLELTTGGLDHDLKSPGRSDPMYLSPRSLALANKPSPVNKPLSPTDEDSIEADMSRLRQINDEILKLTQPEQKRGFHREDEVDINDEVDLRMSGSYEFHAPPRVQLRTQRSQDSDNVIFESKEFMPDLGGDSVDSSALDGCDHFEEIEKSDEDN